MTNIIEKSDYPLDPVFEIDMNTQGVKSNIMNRDATTPKGKSYISRTKATTTTNKNTPPIMVSFNCK